MGPKASVGLRGLRRHRRPLAPGAFRFFPPYRLPPLPLSASLTGFLSPPLSSSLPPSSQWDVSRASAAPGPFSAAVT